MAVNDSLTRDRIRFLGQEKEKLYGVRGQELYDTLQGLGLTHRHYFRALGTTPDEYCAKEFGVDLSRITVERFFQSDPNAKWLFPDVVRDSVLAGMQRGPVYPELIARDEPVTSTSYDVPYMDESDATEQTDLRSIAEGAAIPESELAYGDRTVKLQKVGRGVIASYEAIRRMSVDLLRIHLMRIGQGIGRTLDARVADVLVNGDGSDGDTSAVTINTATANTWDYADLVGGFLKLSTEHGFTPTHMLANSAVAQEILTLPEIADGQVFDFAQTGNMPTPLGVKLVPMPNHSADKVTFLDAGFAAQKVTEQDVFVESDKLINQQWERTYLTLVTDFAIIYEKARVVLNSDWS